MYLNSEQAERKAPKKLNAIEEELWTGWKAGEWEYLSDLDANQIESRRTNYECGIEWLMDFRFQISDSNLRPYTLSILMWRPRNEIQIGPIAFGLTHRRPLRLPEVVWHLRWVSGIVYKTINGHIYFMFMLIFSNLIKTKNTMPNKKISRFVSFFLYLC